VLLVMAYHAGLPLRNGFLGVDVFFVISGYLITGLLVRELTTTGSISWVGFVSRRIRRLLPAATLVLVVTSVVGWFVIPGLRRRELGLDVIAAATSLANWRFAGKASDPLHLEVRQSAVQHFWSLSVEEQFYLVWPLLLIATALLWRRLGRGTPGRAALGLLLAALTVPSFAYAVWLGAQDPNRAYFLTTTRAWELGVGAALAIGLSAHRPSDPAQESRRWPWLVSGLGWCGVAAIAWSALRLPAVNGAPGAWTLVPTLGTAAVLLSGWVGHRAGPARVLGWAPMVWVGGLSYSLYLWHWPAVILTEWASGGVTAGQKVAVVALSVVPAWLGHRFVERPVHHRQSLAHRVPLVLRLGAGVTAAAVVAGALLVATPSPVPTTAAAGAGWVAPDPQLAGWDTPAVDGCVAGLTRATPSWCTRGLPGGATTVAVVGDSKVLQWLPALEQVARERGWRLRVTAKVDCAFAASDPLRLGRPYPTCARWNDTVLAALRAERPALVVTSGGQLVAGQAGATTAPGPDGSGRTTTPGPDALRDGLAQRWRELVQSGSDVAVLADTPEAPDDLDVCTARHATDLGACAFALDARSSGSAVTVQRDAARLAGVTLVDLTEAVCPAGTCPVAVGHVAIHRPDGYLAASFVRTLGPELGARLDAAGR
jgi:peptidoglycan/LPS O-acetylase OafA/YrhL